MELSGKVALITGAASGIGRGIALALAQRGCHLALADINLAGLEETAERLARYPVQTSLHVSDVADREAAAALPDQALQHHAGVDLLVNNAGVGVGGTFEQVSEADFDWLLEVNFIGLVRLTRAFLPLLKASDAARIVNLSSVFGLISPPGQTAYAASKFAVRGFSNALRYELEGTPVGVTVVHPGGVATAIADSSRLPAVMARAQAEAARDRFKKSLVMPPERAGEIIVRGVERDKVRVFVGRDAHVIAALERLFPVSYHQILRRFLPD